MTEPEELGLPERRNHHLPVRDTGKIKASWGFSQHRAREAGGGGGQRSRDKGACGRGCPALCYNYYRNKNHHEVRVDLKITLRASVKLLSFQW